MDAQGKPSRVTGIVAGADKEVREFDAALTLALTPSPSPSPSPSPIHTLALALALALT